MPLKSLAGLGMLLFALVVIAILLPWTDIATKVALQQRVFQNAMATSLQAIKAGELAAIWPLCVATAAYGFVHALGPGHGKVLLGGAAIASGATLHRMIMLSLASSLAQSVCAIVLIATLVFGLQLASRDAVALTEHWLAPISHIAIALIGAMLTVRGIKAMIRLRQVNKDTDDVCGCGHAHGVSVSEVKSLQSTREAVALVISIAIRPCTGALFLLVIAARFDIFTVGILATLTMGLGTALFNILAASSGVAARQLAYVGGAASGPGLQNLSAGMHIAGGLLIVGLSVLLLQPYMV